MRRREAPDAGGFYWPRQSHEMIGALLPFDARLSDRSILGQLIRGIGRYSLAKVDRGSDSVQVHRLIQAVIRSQSWADYDLIWPHLVPSEAYQCGWPGGLVAQARLLQ